jgi:L-cystine transport system permease protein
MSSLAGMFDPAQVSNNLDALVAGAATTLLLSAVATLLAGVAGVALALARGAPLRAISSGSRLYIELVRGTPLLVQMYFLYYGLPSLGLTMSAFTAAAVALALNSGAYVGEILRSAVQSVERSQRESGRALGMGVFATYARIVLPQAFPIALPSLMGEVIDIFKWSSLGAIVVVPEATQVVYQIVGQSYRGFGILFLVLAAFYFAVTTLLVALSRRLERRMTRYRLRLVNA